MLWEKSQEGDERIRIKCICIIFGYIWTISISLKKILFWGRLEYLSSHLQCISVLMRQLNSPYLVSNPIIQYGHALSCCLQQRSAFVRPPNSAYFFAEYPFPHHFVPGIRSKFRISRRLRRR